MVSMSLSQQMEDISLMVDEESRVVERAVAGEREAFGVLAEKYGPALQAMFLARTRHSHDAEDMTMECLTQAWRDLPQLRDPARFRGWLFAIGRNVWRTAMRRAAPPHVPWQDLSSEEMASVSQVPQESPDIRICRALEALPETDQVPLRLYYVEGYSAKEIAERLGVSFSAVRQRLSRGMRRLKDAGDGGGGIL